MQSNDRQRPGDTCQLEKVKTCLFSNISKGFFFYRSFFRKEKKRRKDKSDENITRNRRHLPILTEINWDYNKETYSGPDSEMYKAFNSIFIILLGMDIGGNLRRETNM